MLHSVATIINFCTNEARFIAPCLREALRYSKQVIVPICDHFFDGSLENKKRIDQIVSAFPECLFIQYPYIPDQIPRSILKKVTPAHFWHDVSRLVAFFFLSPQIESVFFLDADEIPDGHKVQEWLDCSDYHQHTTLKMANYWYFRENQYQAEKWEDSVILVQRRALNPDLLVHPEERQGIYDSLPHPKKSMVTGPDGSPLFHHYSWVRTEEEMLKKVRTWGHKEDRNWEELVRNEFKKPFEGVDFVHGYPFKTVEPSHCLEITEETFPNRGGNQKKVLSQEALLKILKEVKMGKSLFFRLF